LRIRAENLATGDCKIVTRSYCSHSSQMGQSFPSQYQSTKSQRKQQFPINKQTPYNPAHSYFNPKHSQFSTLHFNSYDEPKGTSSGGEASSYGMLFSCQYASYILGTATYLKELHANAEYTKVLANDSRAVLNMAFPNKFKGPSAAVLEKLMSAKAAQALSKGLGKPLLGVGVALSAVDVYQNGGSWSSWGWALADNGIAIAAFFVSGPAAPFVAAGAVIYFTGRFAYGVYEAYNEGN